MIRRLLVTGATAALVLAAGCSDWDSKRDHATQQIASLAADSLVGLIGRTASSPAAHPDECPLKRSTPITPTSSFVASLPAFGGSVPAKYDRAATRNGSELVALPAQPPCPNMRQRAV